MTIHRRRGGGYGWYYAAFWLFGICLVIAGVAFASGATSVTFTPWRPVLGVVVVGALAAVVRWRSGRG